MSETQGAEERPVFYRYFTTRKTDGFDDAIRLDGFRVELHRETFIGVKRTRAGWWVEKQAGWINRKRRFISDLPDPRQFSRLGQWTHHNLPRRLAYRDETHALWSLRRRAEMGRWRAQLSVQTAELTIAAITEKTSAEETANG